MRSASRAGCCASAVITISRKVRRMEPFFLPVSLISFKAKLSHGLALACPLKVQCGAVRCVGSLISRLAMPRGVESSRCRLLGVTMGATSASYGLALSRGLYKSKTEPSLVSGFLSCHGDLSLSSVFHRGVNSIQADLITSQTSGL